MGLLYRVARCLRLQAQCLRVQMFVLAAAAFSPQISFAAEWSFQPSAETYLDHDSNRLLTVVPGAERSDEAAWLTAEADLRRSTETDEIVFRPRLERQQFIGDSGFDSTNGYLQASGRHVGEVYSYSGDATFSDLSTLRSELADTGIIASGVRQQLTSGNFTFEDQFAERHRLGVQAAYTNVNYTRNEGLGLTDYRHVGGSGGYTFGYSPRLDLNVFAFAGHESAPDTGFTSSDVGGQAGIDWTISERTKLAATGGLSRTSFGGERENGNVWSIQAEQTRERGIWRVSLTRDVVPNSVGFLTRRDQINVTAQRKLTERTDISATALAVSNHDDFFHLAETNRRYFTGTIGLFWHMTERWTLSTQLRGSTVRYVGGAGSYDRANGWQASVRLRWTPLMRTFSR